MKISTRGRYGTRALAELAKHHGKGPLALKEIANRQEVPIKYLEQIAMTLREAGLIVSVRGPAGGYVLTKPPDHIDLLEIIEALEGPLSFVNCVRDPSACHKVGSCAFNDLWRRVSEETAAIFRAVTLDQMAKQDASNTSALLECLEAEET